MDHTMKPVTPPRNGEIVSGRVNGSRNHLDHELYMVDIKTPSGKEYAWTTSEYKDNNTKMWVVMRTLTIGRITRTIVEPYFLNHDNARSPKHTSLSLPVPSPVRSQRRSSVQSPERSPKSLSSPERPRSSVPSRKRSRSSERLRSSESTRKRKLTKSHDNHLNSLTVDVKAKTPTTVATVTATVATAPTEESIDKSPHITFSPTEDVQKAGSGKTPFGNYGLSGPIHDRDGISCMYPNLKPRKPILKEFPKTIPDEDNPIQMNPDCDYKTLCEIARYHNDDLREKKFKDHLRPYLIGTLTSSANLLYAARTRKIEVVAATEQADIDFDTSKKKLKDLQIKNMECQAQINVLNKQLIANMETVAEKAKSIQDYAERCMNSLLKESSNPRPATAPPSSASNGY